MEYVIEEEYGQRYTHVVGNNLTMRIDSGLLFIEDGAILVLAIQVARVLAIRNPSSATETWPPKAGLPELLATMQRETFGSGAVLTGAFPPAPSPDWLPR